MFKEKGKCKDYERLQNEVEKILQKLTELTTRQLEAFQQQDQSTFTNIDKELENTMGEKERSIGAARQHAKEHGCQGIP